MISEINLRSRVTRHTFQQDTDPLDIFHSYLRNHTAYRRVVGGDWYNSVVVFDDQQLGRGEDPRMFSLDGEPAFVACIYENGALRNRLFDCSFGDPDIWELKTPEWVEQGKNWSPFETAENTVGFVHSFDPPLILLEDSAKCEADDAISLRAVEGTCNVSEMGPGNFPAYRGGSNGLMLPDGRIFGIGHKTTTKEIIPDWPLAGPPGYHRPFGWFLDLETLHIEVIPCHFDWKFDCVDPTCLLRCRDEGVYQLITTECPHHFHDTKGNVEVASYVFTLEA